VLGASAAITYSIILSQDNMNALTTFVLVIYYYTAYTVSGAAGWITKSPSSHHGANSILPVPRGGHGGDATTVDDDDAPLVIIIDVDNCLYLEQDLLTSVGEGIETQIVRNTHLFGLLHFNLTSEDCDDLYKKYGSTIEGLRHTLPSHLVEDTMRKFYRGVYDPIDFGCLLGIRAGIVKNEDDVKSRSGYDHGHALQKRRALAELLESISDIHPVYFASNSPKAHIMRVLNSMGLRNIKLAGILSPDAEGDGGSALYPTKSSPQQYYKRILSQHSPQSKRIILLDDSLYNIRQASTVGIHGIHVNGKDRTLEEGLAEALGHILPSDNTLLNSTSSRSRYKFSDVKYLRAKNKVDANAIDTMVWESLAEELALRLQQKKNGILRVADLGAGMLSMLKLFLNGGGEDKRQKASMFTLISNILGSSGNSGEQLTKLEYFAYESNTNLLDGCKEELRKMGFHKINGNSCWQLSLSNMEVTVHLLTTDFQNEQHPPESLDLILGCCFADLFEPDQLVLSLHRFAHKSNHPPLVYLPITFAGGTRFSSTHPFAENENSNRLVPSDTTAFQLYSRSLISHGHNLDPSRIVNAICNFGGSLITKGSSDWIIQPQSNEYLWETMMYFFGMSGASEITKNGLDAEGWIRRSRRDARTIIASNVDLLFHLADSSSTKKNGMYSIGRNEDSDSSSTLAVEEILFVSPYNVTTVNKEWDRNNLGPDQIEVESLCSLVSSGTELKIFKGSFESASLDVNIKGMADEAMEYPLAYGYSLVGRVFACGSNVDESLIGRTVFTFSPHSSRVVVDRDAVQIVPDGIEAEDAIFMPSVETALSLVHDAHVRLGENVAVFGQGLIGLLVTAILCLHHSSNMSSSRQFCSVTAFDALDDRLDMSSNMGATSALKPPTAGIAGPFDVSIEVSGNPRALQSAIDNTSNNGRIIIGSWYGAADVALKLGIDFHRSHKTIQTSQVSTIPSTMTGLWNKERRFALTWALVRSLQPSRLISKRMTLTDVQEAYELLDGGKEIAICFKYNN